MSQSLPIPAQRWLSLLLCAITAAAITVFLSNVSLVQQAYASWGSILNTSPVLHYSFALLAGIGIKLMLDKFYISHAKRSIGFNWRYPPVTISVLFGLLFIVGYVYSTHSDEALEQLSAHTFGTLKFIALSFIAIAATTIYQTKLYTAKPVFSAVLCAVSAFYLFAAINLVEIEHAFWVFFCIAIAYLSMSVYLLWEQLKVSSSELIVESKQEVELKLESLEDFRKWFKDDSIIKNKEDLETDLQVYADRLTERLRNGGDKSEEDIAQHIALCGPYGCGKSSIVAAITNELKKPKQVKLESSDKEKLKVKQQQNKINWIHNDISTWGAASGSVAHVILSNIIDDISQHIDMCAFRALPKHYTEALKSGGSLFQFASTLLAGPVDIEGSFQKLNNVLKVTNHKLLITLQDVDRGTGDENEKRLNDIAALLDRLKSQKLSQINFVIAMGNDKPEHLEVLSKVADHIESIITVDFKGKLCNWAELCVKEISNDKNKMVLLNADVANRLSFSKIFYQPAIISNQLIPSIRLLKRIMRRIDLCWNKDNLLGEVAFDSLFMLTTLREANPSLYTAFVKSYPSLINSKAATVAKSEDGKQRSINEILSDLISEFNNWVQPHVYNAFFKKLLDLKEDVKAESGNSIKGNKKGSEQHLGIKPDTVDYLKRILLEAVPESELRDQNVIKKLKVITSVNVKEIASDIVTDNRWLEAFERFHFHIDEACKKSLTYEILNQQVFTNNKLFETNGALHKLISEEMCNGSFKDILNKLVEIDSAQALLSGVVKQFFDIEYIRNKLPALKLGDTDNNQYYNVKDMADRKAIADKTKLWTQHMNILEFLDNNIDKLNEEAFETLIKLLTFTQFESFISTFVEQRIKNIFEVYKMSNSQSAIIKLIDLSMTPRIEELNLLVKQVKSQDENFKIDLKSRIEKADVSDKQDIKAAIRHLDL